MCSLYFRRWQVTSGKDHQYYDLVGVKSEISPLLGGQNREKRRVIWKRDISKMTGQSRFYINGITTEPKFRRAIVPGFRMTWLEVIRQVNQKDAAAATKVPAVKFTELRCSADGERSNQRRPRSICPRLCPAPLHQPRPASQRASKQGRREKQTRLTIAAAAIPTIVPVMLTAPLVPAGTFSQLVIR